MIRNDSLFVQINIHIFTHIQVIITHNIFKDQEEEELLNREVQGLPLFW